jgi:hypothetical protein
MSVLKYDALITTQRERLRDALAIDLPGLARFLPSVERIEVLAVHVASDRLERRDRWVGRATSALARRLLPLGTISWTIRSSWQLASCVIVWELEPPALPVSVSGCGRVELGAAPGAQTRVTMSGSVEVGNPARSGVLLKRGIERIEEAISSLVQSNVNSLFEGVSALLQSQSGELAVGASSPWTPAPRSGEW